MDFALLGEFDGVVDEVGDDLTKAQRIADQIWRDGIGNLGENLQSLVVGLLSGDRGYGGDDVVEAKFDGLDVELSRLRSSKSPECR